VSWDTSKDREINRWAARQRGVVATRQLGAIGMTERDIERRVRVERLVRLQRGVLKVAGSPDNWHQRAFVACLAHGPGAVLSGSSAARLLGLDLPPSEVVELTVPRSVRPKRSPRVSVHRSRYLPDHDRTSKLGLPVTTAARTLLDLAGRLTSEEMCRVLDDAVIRNLVRAREVSLVLSDPRYSTTPGRGMLRAALAPLLDQKRPAESVPEMEIVRLLAREGIPSPVLQYEVSDGGVLIARLDLAWPECRVGLEVDSFQYHSSPRALARDRNRSNELAKRDWFMIHTSPDEFRKDPRSVLQAIRTQLRRRAAGSADKPQ
jgi:hypothetical protein